MGRSKTIFISYYHEDKKYKDLLVAWARNSSLPVNFVDHSTDLSVCSRDIAVVRRAVSAKIRGADCFLCLVGENTHTSDWVNWEVDKAFERNRSIIAVKISRSYKSPLSLLRRNARWVYTFRVKQISQAMQDVI